VSYQDPVTQADLHAFVDGQLDPARQCEVEVYLERNPEAMAMVKDYQNMDRAISAHFAPLLEEPVPEHLLAKPAKSSFRILRVAAVVGWMVAGGVIGWFMNPAVTVMQTADSLTAKLVQPATFAHRVYTPEIRHPVEVPGKQRQHLSKWLSKRLKTRIQIPDLGEQGYELVGGRLLPSNDSVAAQFMYQRDDGVRVTLYNRHGVWDNKQLSFQYVKQGETSLFYWIDGPLGFALVGNLSKQELSRLSESVYQQLNE